MNIFVSFVGLLILFMATPLHAATWPASDATGTSIGDALRASDATFEPSGIVWHRGRNQLVLVGDEGQVATMNADGSHVTIWNLGSTYDLEDVTIADATSSLVYVLDENSSSALEFDLETGLLTGKSWNFASVISEVGGTSGTEGLTWVNGSFYVGWQYDGDIYVFAADLTTSGSSSFVQEIHMTSGYTDLAALAYDSSTERVYALYDGLDIVEERSVDGTWLTSYSVPGSDQEGITLMIDCESSTASVVIAEDSGQVMRYDGYPVSCTASTSASTTTEISTEPEAGEVVEGTTPLTVTAVTGLSYGDVTVDYSDGTTTTFDLFSVGTTRVTKTRAITGTPYYLAAVNRYAALIDPLTGEVFASIVFSKGEVHRWAWVKETLGL